MAQVFSIKLEKFPTVLEPGVAAQRIRDLSITTVNRVGVIVRGSQIRVAPVVTGLSNLKSAFINIPAQVIGNRVQGAVVASSPIPNIIDKGAKPHFPPVGPDPEKEPALGPWIRRKLSISDDKEVRAIAFKIGRRFQRDGIKPKRTFTKAALAVLPIVNREFERLRQQIQIDLGRP